MKKISLIFSLLALFLPGLEAQTSADAIVGTWKNGEGTAHIQIYKNKEKYQGKIVWLREPNDEAGKPKTDKKHPDASVRSRPVLGLVNLWGFIYKSADQEWSGGSIYDPKNGKTYDCVISLKDNATMKVRGFVMGMRMMGRTDTWVRQ